MTGDKSSRQLVSSKPEDSAMLWYALFFLISGFCGILYELIWLRLAMAQFGVTTALVSIVLSNFMAGLGAGSLGAGAFVKRYGNRVRFPGLRLYALSELLIAISAIAVPYELALGHRLLAHMAGSTSFSSITYYLISGGWVALTLVPWCACMGATIPLAMFAIRQDPGKESTRSFSFLYLANVIGAAAGAIIPLFLIEARGFHATLYVGACCNLSVALVAFALSTGRVSHANETAETGAAVLGQSRRPLLLLFVTGFTTMGLELVWIRLFTPYVGVMVYSFALILLTYLVGTFIGSYIYRRSSRTPKVQGDLVWVILAALAVIPLALCDPRIPKNFLPFGILLRVAIAVMPFAGAAGYLTPKLVDEWSGGNPDRAANAYAMNVLGCILGPLFSGFVVLPLLSERWVLFVYALLLMAVGWRVLFVTKMSRVPAIAWGLAVATILLVDVPESFESIFPKREVRRDNTATVLAATLGPQKILLVNGIGMTSLTPITKVMAHMPLAFLDHRPQNALVICFGMGTTYRSFLSWGIPTTAVDLVPSVPKLFEYFHPDAPQLLQITQSHIVVDDGRRYLERTAEKYDVITIDPPPPVFAAGSSLLYSSEFYQKAKSHLRSGGILQQWIPWGSDDFVYSSAAQAIRMNFRYVRVFHSLTRMGYHFLASDSPLPQLSAQDLALKLPPAAIADFVEWGPARTAQGQFEIMLKNEVSLPNLIDIAPNAPVLQDDRPTNEYFLWRKSRSAGLEDLVSMFR